MILGALLLFHRDELAPSGEFWFIAAGAGTAALILAALSAMAVSIQSLPMRTGAESFIGMTAIAEKDILPDGGKLFVEGALWDARASSPILAGTLVEIIKTEGLRLIVQAKREE